MTFHAVVVAAGSGSRAGGPKQWRMLAGKPVVRWSVEALLDAGAQAIALVIPAGGEAEAQRALAGLPRWFTVPGGAERAHSVRNGLEALAGQAPERVLVHDAARPFLTRKIVNDLVDALEKAEAALPALPVSDTLKRATDGDGDGHGAARRPVARPDAPGLPLQGAGRGACGLDRRRGA